MGMVFVNLHPLHGVPALLGQMYGPWAHKADVMSDLELEQVGKSRAKIASTLTETKLLKVET